MNTIHTICIVDDDEEIRSLLSDYLRRNGFSTCTAGNAAEFLEIQRRVPCSLIVMDIMLPGMNGLELFRTLRAESTVPVIFLTALGDITDRIVGLELGADDYLSCWPASVPCCAAPKAAPAATSPRPRPCSSQAGCWTAAPAIWWRPTGWWSP